MTVGPDEFRGALRKFASGITIVTAAVDAAFYGMTCTSFASVSLEPPLVLVSLENDSHTLRAVTRAGTFAASMLNAAQEDIARAFSTPGPKSFDTIDHKLAGNGAPLVLDAIALLECDVVEVVAAGDHHIIVGSVQWCETNGGDPLLYFDRAYRRLG